MKGLLKFNSDSNNLKMLYRSVMAFICSLIAGGIFIALSGFSPLEIYAVIFQGSLGTTNGIITSLAQATPIMFTGLAFAIAFKVGIINTGAEGQLFAGGIVSALVGAYVNWLPGITHVAVAVLAGAIAGGLVGLLTGYIKVKFGSSEVITGIMLNSIITLFTGYLANGPLKPEGSSTAQTEPVLATAKLAKLVERSQLTYAFIIAIVVAIMLHFLLSKTVWGYKMQVVGMNKTAGEVAGIPSSKVYMATLALSGGIAGLAGAALVLGVYGRFVDVLSVGLGFEGIPVAALAAYNPLAVTVSALLFGVLKAGAFTLNRTTLIPVEFVNIIQSFVVVFVAAPRIIEILGIHFKVFRKKKDIKADTLSHSNR